MDKSGDDPVVKLDDDRDVDFDHVISSNDICSEQHNEVGDKNNPEDVHFGSESEAYVFYNEYARVHGFVVRRDEMGRDSNGNMNMCQYVCNREGLRNKKHFLRVDRKKEHKPVTRTNCQAKLQIHLDYKTSKWKVVSFEECHNHDPTPPKFVHLHPAYCGITDADKAHVDCLRSNGVIKEKEKPVHGSQMKENKRICLTKKSVKGTDTTLPLLDLSVKFMKASNLLIFHMELSLTFPNVSNPLIPVEFDLKFPKFFNQVFMGVYAMKFPEQPSEIEENPINH
ncbi:FAR1 DNA-binding domain [Sesbania bispinosa]|nr:FAR1 DNA-binding domain [Sesbania bispinosa]